MILVRLASAATTESEHRAAINRVYYGLHHDACCRYFRTEPAPQPLNRNRRHTDLRERFNRPQDAVASNVGQLLGRLMRLRNEADYQLQPPLRYQNRSYTSERLMRRAVDTGEELKLALETYSPGESPDGCDCPEVYAAR